MQGVTGDGWLQMKNSMVVGYDAYQDSANKGKSVGAAVFSMDAAFSRWYSQCALHSKDREQIANICDFCTSPSTLCAIV